MFSVVNPPEPSTQNLPLPPCYNTPQASPPHADSPYSAFEAIRKNVAERPGRRTGKRAGVRAAAQFDGPVEGARPVAGAAKRRAFDSGNPRAERRCPRAVGRAETGRGAAALRAGLPVERRRTLRPPLPRERDAPLRAPRDRHRHRAAAHRRARQASCRRLPGRRFAPRPQHNHRLGVRHLPKDRLPREL